MSDIFIKLVKYCVIGFSGILIDFSTTYLLKEKIRVNKYLANSTGFVFAASSNFILNRIWTFNNNTNTISTAYFLFFSIALIGLLLNNLIIYLLTKKMNYNFYLSKGIAIVVVTFWNFFMNYTFTFH